MEQPKLPKLKLPDRSEMRSRLLFTVGALVLLYMLVATFQALWQNYQLNKELASLRQENGDLTVQNNYLQDLIAYRQTDSYKDKEAREKLNYQKAGETVLIVPQDAAQRFTEGNAQKQPDVTQTPTNPDKWWQYFFS